MALSGLDVFVFKILDFYKRIFLLILWCIIFKLRIGLRIKIRFAAHALINKIYLCKLIWLLIIENIIITDQSVKHFPNYVGIDFHQSAFFFIRLPSLFPAMFESASSPTECCWLTVFYTERLPSAGRAVEATLGGGLCLTVDVFRLPIWLHNPEAR